jgi:hypothetical protein
VSVRCTVNGMGDRFAKWWPSAALAVAFGTVLSGASGPTAMALVWALTAAVFAWNAGRLYEDRIQARSQLIMLLMHFTDWAERTLAQTPGELAAEDEELRAQLQSDYHQARRLLDRLL